MTKIINYSAQNLTLIVSIFIWLPAFYLLIKNQGRVSAKVSELGNKIDESTQGLKREIKDSVQEKFIEISPSTEALIGLAVEVWRISKRIKKAEKTMDHDQVVFIQNSLAKFQKFLSNNDLEIKEYTDQKYNPGVNLEILSMQKTADIPESIIGETVEPAILHKGQVVRKAKVIIYEKA